MIRASALFLMALAPPAGAFELAMPLACDLGKTCYIQQFPDHDPGPGATDFTCGTLSYEGHDGTDFALPSRAAMAAGVQVLAAAPGVVKGTRDGVADFVPPVPGKECGNGVVIDHADGWQTQYCHLRNGSIRVQPGQTVAAGTVLGLVGQSGKAEFPHLHLSLRKDGAQIDPFRPDAAPECAPKPPPATPAAAAVTGLWQEPMPYVGGGLLQAGLAGAPPDYDAVKSGLPAAPTLAPDAAALILWAYGFDSRAGDVLRFSIAGPDGFAFAHEAVLDKPQALFFRYAGKRAPAAGFAAGRYAATVLLLREGRELGRQNSEIRLGG